MASIPEADKAALYAPDNLAAFVQAISEGYRSGSWGVAHDAIISRDWGFDLGAFRVPVDVWHGEADKNVPIRGGRYLAAVLPRMVLGYLLWMRAPQVEWLPHQTPGI